MTNVAGIKKAVGAFRLEESSEINENVFSIYAILTSEQLQ